MNSMWFWMNSYDLLDTAWKDMQYLYSWTFMHVLNISLDASVLKCIFMGLKMKFSPKRLYDKLRVSWILIFKTWFYCYFSFASKIIIYIHEIFFCKFIFLLNLCILVFDQLDLVTYEEVVKLPAFKRKTLVLLGKFDLYKWLSYSHLQNIFRMLLTIVNFNFL